jgi:hypothetical protein
MSRTVSRHLLTTRFATSLLAGILWCPAPGDAQTGISATIGDRVDRTAQQGASEDTGHAPAATATLDYTWDEERARAFYAIEAGTFSTPGDWFYQLHTAGADYGRPLGSDRRRFFAGASVSWRGNGASWSESGYTGLSAYTNLQASQGAATWRSGYRLTRRVFGDLPELDHFEHAGFGSVLLNLPTRTTIIGEVTLGAKRFDATAVGAAADGVWGDVSPSSGARGHLRGTRSMGPGIRMSRLQVSQSSAALAGQAGLFARVAQSIADRTAVSLDASVRRTFGDVPPAVVATPELFFNDGVYDDPFSSDAESWRGGVKHVRPSGWTIEGGVARFTRDYVGTFALDAAGAVLPGEPLRADIIWGADLQAKVPVAPARIVVWTVDLLFGYVYTRHESNDAFYDYRSHRVGVALSLAR